RGVGGGGASGVRGVGGAVGIERPGDGGPGSEDGIAVVPPAAPVGTSTGTSVVVAESLCSPGAVGAGAGGVVSLAASGAVDGVEAPVVLGDGSAASLADDLGADRST